MSGYKDIIDRAASDSAFRDGLLAAAEVCRAQEALLTVRAAVERLHEVDERLADPGFMAEKRYTLDEARQIIAMETFHRCANAGAGTGLWLHGDASASATTDPQSSQVPTSAPFTAVTWADIEEPK